MVPEEETQLQWKDGTKQNVLFLSTAGEIVSDPVEERLHHAANIGKIFCIERHRFDLAPVPVHI